jgi:hypothetical protein
VLALSNKTHIGVVEEGREAILPVAALCEIFGVDALIRLSVPDYDLFEGMRDRFVHFNLEFTLNEIGGRYAILPILRRGHRNERNEEVLPVVDRHRHRVGICDEVFQRVPVDDVAPELFRHSLPNIRTAQELRSALLLRYARLFPQLAAEELLTRGCAITSLALR